VTSYVYHSELARILDQAWREAQARRDRYYEDLPIGAVSEIEPVVDATLQTLHRIAKLSGLEWTAR